MSIGSKRSPATSSTFCHSTMRGLPPIRPSISMSVLGSSAFASAVHARS